MFEKEIDYQIYRLYLPPVFMNYQRVVVQLLTLGIKLAEINNDKFNEKVYDRPKISCILQNCIDKNNGFLPTGANDDSFLDL